METTQLGLHPAATFELITGEREKKKKICAGELFIALWSRHSKQCVNALQRRELSCPVLIRLPSKGTAEA